MTAQIDQFCDKLKDRLDAMAQRIQSAKSQIEGLPEQGEKSVRKLLDNARSNVEAWKQRLDQGLANLRAQTQLRVAETKEEVARWKQHRDAWKLNDRADRAEAYSVDAVDYGIAVIEKAKDAVLEAVAARLDADAAQ